MSLIHVVYSDLFYCSLSEKTGYNLCRDFISLNATEIIQPCLLHPDVETEGQRLNGLTQEGQSQDQKLDFFLVCSLILPCCIPYILYCILELLLLRLFYVTSMCSVLLGTINILQKSALKKGGRWQNRNVYSQNQPLGRFPELWVRRAGGARLAVLAGPRHVPELKHIILGGGVAVGKAISPKWLLEMFLSKAAKVFQPLRDHLTTWGASHIDNLKFFSNHIKK